MEVPHQSIEFLGFLVNLTTMSLALPAQKTKGIRQDAQHLLLQDIVLVREIACFLGKATASSTAVWQAPLHYRALQRMVNSVIPADQYHLDMTQKYCVRLSWTREAKADLCWWKSFATVEAPIVPRTPHIVINSDASTIGWGACQGDKSTGGQWSVEEAAHHINYLELLATFLAIQCLQRITAGILCKTVLIKTDSVTAMTYINNMGLPTVSAGTFHNLWEWCLEREIFLVAEHLPGKKNTTADQESRMTKDQCDRMLNQYVFSQIQTQMGPYNVDLFASCLLKLLPRFFSWRPDPQAEKVDAFSQDWSQIRGYANPPWCLISLVV